MKDCISDLTWKTSRKSPAPCCSFAVVTQNCSGVVVDRHRYYRSSDALLRHREKLTASFLPLVSQQASCFEKWQHWVFPFSCPCDLIGLRRLQGLAYMSLTSFHRRRCRPYRRGKRSRHPFHSAIPGENCC